MRRLVIANISAMQALDEGAGSYARLSLVRSPSSFASTADELTRFARCPKAAPRPWRCWWATAPA